MDWISDFFWGFVGPLEFVIIWLIGEIITWLSTWPPWAWLAMAGGILVWGISKELGRLSGTVTELDALIRERPQKPTKEQKERRDAWEAAVNDYELLCLPTPTDPRDPKQ